MNDAYFVISIVVVIPNQMDHLINVILILSKTDSTEYILHITYGVDTVFLQT